MRCPNHPKDRLTRNDFYWHKEGWQKNPRCKACIAKGNKEKYTIRKVERALYFQW